MISIFVSFLHFGQKRGKLTRIVSLLTLILVLPLQMGQRTQKESFGVCSVIIPPKRIIVSSNFLFSELPVHHGDQGNSEENIKGDADVQNTEYLSE